VEGVSVDAGDLDAVSHLGWSARLVQYRDNPDVVARVA
jgi:hypothetical protein